MEVSPLATPAALPLPNAYWVLPGQLLAGEHPREEVDAERGDQCGENAEQELRQPVVAQEQYEDPERGRVEQPAPGVGGSTIRRLGPARGDQRPGP